MRNPLKIIFFSISFSFAYFLSAYVPFLCGMGYAERVSDSPSTVMPYGTGAQYYVYLGANKGLQINVQIWGQVLRPGMYSVPKTTDVIGLISFAGGPTEDANLKKVKLVRSNPKPEVIIVNLNKYMKTGDISSIPVLKRGDTIIIHKDISHWFSSVIRVVSQIAIVANTYYLFFGSSRDSN